MHRFRRVLIVLFAYALALQGVMAHAGAATSHDPAVLAHVGCLMAAADTAGDGPSGLPDGDVEVPCAIKCKLIGSTIPVSTPGLALPATVSTAAMPAESPAAPAGRIAGRGPLPRAPPAA